MTVFSNLSSTVREGVPPYNTEVETSLVPDSENFSNKNYKTTSSNNLAKLECVREGNHGHSKVAQTNFDFPKQQKTLPQTGLHSSP